MKMQFTSTFRYVRNKMVVHAFVIELDYSALLWQKEASDIPSKFELLMFS